MSAQLLVVGSACILGGGAVLESDLFLDALALYRLNTGSEWRDEDARDSPWAGFVPIKRR